MMTALQFIWKRVDERLVYKGCDLWCDWQQRVDACGLRQGLPLPMQLKERLTQSWGEVMGGGVLDATG